MWLKQRTKIVLGGAGLLLGMAFILSGRSSTTIASATELRAATGGECWKCGDLDYSTCSSANNGCVSANEYIEYTDIAIYNPYVHGTGSAIDALEADVCANKILCTDCWTVGSCSGPGGVYIRKAAQCTPVGGGC